VSRGEQQGLTGSYSQESALAFGLFLIMLIDSFCETATTGII
jgi:hypothetical protein